MDYTQIHHPFAVDLLVFAKSKDKHLKRQQILLKPNLFRNMDEEQKNKIILENLPKLEPDLNFDKVIKKFDFVESQLVSIIEGDEDAKKVLETIQLQSSMNNLYENKEEELISPISTLIIRSLIWIICSTRESDPEKRKEMYNTLHSILEKFIIFNSSMDVQLNDLKRIHFKFCRIFNREISRLFVFNNSLPRRIDFRKLGKQNFYLKTFQEIETISHGGFGVVKKAIHLMDRCEYAIKQITLPDPEKKKNKNKIENLLKEVKLNALLENENIVSYKTSWLEYFFDSEDSESSNERYTLDSSDLSTDKSNEKSDLLQPNKSDDAIKSKFYGPSSSSSESSPSNSNQRPEKKKLILFIQMELCGQNLKTYLQDRNNKPIHEIDLKLEISYFIQILDGVKYLHHENLIHRDLKPSNILFSLDGKRIKIADFGLSTYSLLKGNSSLNSLKLSNEIGTSIYGAPEQLSVNSSYDKRADIYSLGIILFEMVHPMNTEFEKSKCLENLKRNRILPENFMDYNDGMLAKLIIQMTEIEPAKRPKNVQIILNILSPRKRFPSKMQYEKTIRDLQLENEKLKREIAILKKNQKEPNENDL